MRRPFQHEHRHPLRWRHRLAHSLKWRLVGLFLLLAVGVTALFAGSARQAFGTGWRDLVRPLLADYVDRLAAEVGSPPDVAQAQALVRRLPLAVRIEGPVVNWRSDRAVSAEAAAADEAARDPGPRDQAWRELTSRRTADGHRVSFRLSLLRSDEHPRWWQWVHWWPLVGLLALTAAAFAYVRRLFKPLDDIRSGALRFGAGRFEPPIPLRRHDELGELAHHVNQMAANLSGMLEGQRALLLAISHELRSPLTRARLNAELVSEGAERDALLRDLGEMRDLIADLLESSRLAAGALQRSPQDLNAAVREAVAAVEAAPGSAAVPGRAALQVSVQLDPALPTLALDASRVQLLLRNLLANARQHGASAPGEPARVQVETVWDAERRQVHLTVRDHGPGVPEDQLQRLAQAFARPDAARSRSAGGVGLGLYLCRLVAEGHGGRLALANAAPGLRVTVSLPG